jgi:hypothetical protein
MNENSIKILIRKAIRNRIVGLDILMSSLMFLKRHSERCNIEYLVKLGEGNYFLDV